MRCVTYLCYYRMDGKFFLSELSMSLQIKFLNFILGFAQQRLIWLANILRGRLSPWQGHVKVTRERRERGSRAHFSERPCTHPPWGRAAWPPLRCVGLGVLGPRRLLVCAHCGPRTYEGPERFQQPRHAQGRVLEVSGCHGASGLASMPGRWWTLGGGPLAAWGWSSIV